MAALTSDRDTVFRNGDEFEAASAIFAGAMVCLNGDGKAVPASITAGLTSVVGVAQRRAATGERYWYAGACSLSAANLPMSQLWLRSAPSATRPTIIPCRKLRKATRPLPALCAM